MLTRIPEWDVDLDNAAPLPHLDGAGLGDAPGVHEVTAVPLTDSPQRGRPAPATSPTRRHYDSTLRRQRAAETRERIIAAESEMLPRLVRAGLDGLTIRAVAERAGVNERTVYRHFVNEQGLHDAVMHQFEEEAGIDLRGMHLEDVADVTARIFAHVSSYPPDPLSHWTRPS